MFSCTFKNNNISSVRIWPWLSADSVTLHKCLMGKKVSAVRSEAGTDWWCPADIHHTYAAARHTHTPCPFASAPGRVTGATRVHVNAVPVLSVRPLFNHASAARQ